MDDDQDQAERPELDLQQLAAAEAVRQLVGLVTVMAGTAGIVYMLNHRYVIEQLGRRARDLYDQWRNPHRAAEARAVAELQRDISRYEHAQAARAHPERRRGLYEQGP